MNKRVINTIPYLMPVGPAIVLAMILSRVFQIAKWPSLFSWIVAVTLAIIFEAAGYQIAHGFIAQGEAKNHKYQKIMLAFLILVVASGVLVIVWGHKDVGSDLVVAMLAAFPILSAMVYITQAMRLGVDQKQDLAQVQDAEEWHLKMDIKRQREEAKIKARFGQKSQSNAQLTPTMVPPHKTNGTGQMSSLFIANQSKQGQIATRRDRVNQLLSEGLNQGQIATELNVSRKTIGRDVKDLNEAS